MSNLDYLGKGIAWPVTLNDHGSISYASELQLVSQSILRYLDTPLGNSYFNEDIGSRINQIQFEPDDTLLEGILEMLINETIDNFEKRAKYIETVFERTEELPGVIQCRIYVNLVRINRVGSFIWPYYREKPEQI